MVNIEDAVKSPSIQKDSKLHSWLLVSVIKQDVMSIALHMQKMTRKAIMEPMFERWWERLVMLALRLVSGWSEYRVTRRSDIAI